MSKEAAFTSQGMKINQGLFTLISLLIKTVTQMTRTIASPDWMRIPQLELCSLISMILRELFNHIRDKNCKRKA